MPRFPISRILLLPSSLCLDAPLVAVGWAILLAAKSEAAKDFPTLAALFCAVWAIYLLDRIRDTQTQPASDGEPLRHQFTRRHPRFLIALFAIAAACGTWVALSGLQKETLLTGVGVAAATALYFLTIGWRNRSSKQLRLPVKEIAIAACFAIGVKIGAGQGKPITWLAWDTLALSSLFLANCLVISKAEATHDRRADPFAFFSSKPQRSSLWITIPAGLAATLGIGLALRVCPGLGVSIIIGSLGQIAVSRSLADHPQWVQPACDGVLLIPWVAVAFS